MQVKIQATQPQADFLALDCKFPAFIAGFGTGKSEIMCVSALLDSMEGGADSLIALYEPTYDLVRLILAPRLEEKLADWGIRYKYNKSENIIYTSSGQMGDFILRTLDNPARIVGYESFRAKIDEIDTLKLDHARDAWTKIIARNRQKPKTYQPNSGKPCNTVSVFSTPEGFKFAYERWAKDPVDGYEMIQAATKSNPFLPEDYIESLRSTYPEQLIEAYLNGQFINLTSGTVYRSYNRVKHRSTETIKEGEPLFVGMDFNIDKMAATVYVLRGEAFHAIGEITNGYNTPTVAQTLKERYEGHKIIVYPDSSGKNRTRMGGVSESDIAVLSGEFGFECRYHPTNPAVRDRINATNAAFEKGKLFVNDEACPNVASCYEQQTYDDNGEPDKKGGKDHQNDASTYPIAYEMPIIRPAANINVTFGH